MESNLLNRISYDIIQVVDRPAKKFNFISVTSSDDKIPVSILIKKILQYLGRNVRVVDTIKNISVREYDRTSLEYHRINLYDLDIRIFTDLAQLPNENQKNIELYKESLIKLFKTRGLDIINVDDPLLRKISENRELGSITYGINTPADLLARDIRFSQDGISFILDFHGSQKKVKLNSFNKANVYNALAAIGACYFLGLPLTLIITALNHIKIFN